MNITVDMIPMKEFMNTMTDKERREFTKYYIKNVWRF